jgi:hypothetical protein
VVSIGIHAILIRGEFNFGLLLSPQLLGMVNLNPDSEGIRLLAELIPWLEQK